MLSKFFLKQPQTNISKHLTRILQDIYNINHLELFSNTLVLFIMIQFTCQFHQDIKITKILQI